MITELQLAAAIAAYETDEPHLPDSGNEEYPDITPEIITEWMASEHNGDCVNQPMPCVRCFGETVVHKAAWIFAKLFSDLPRE
jgi:hypothetical protein